MKQAKAAIATTLLERLLPEEQAREYEEEDLEVQGSSKCFRPSFCARRVRFCGPSDDFRILDRKAPFGQSAGRWSVENARFRKRGSITGDMGQLTELFLGDIYHAILDAPLRLQLLAFFAFYMLSFVFFALLYLWIAEPCGLQCAGSFIKAYMLSVETMTTVGYGVSDPYMHGCWQGAVVLTAQCLQNILMGAWFIGVIFQGLSRPQSRASTIVFSDKAVIRRVDGAHYLMFRICDLRIQNALIEPHVRCYVAMMQGSSGCQMVPMRLEQPDDELGGSLLLTLPTTIVHRIDAWSPLAPQHLKPQDVDTGRYPSRQATRSFESTPRSVVSEPSEAGASSSSASEQPCQLADGKRGQEYLRVPAWPGTLKRQVDCETGGRDSCVCHTCGSSFATAWMLERHCRYSAKSDVLSGFPPELCHKELSSEELEGLTHRDPDRWEIKDHFSTHYLEVVVIVEGIEPTTSSSLQARHSYVIGGPGGDGDVAWDMAFAECCRVSQEPGRGLALDLGRFHAVEPIGPAQATA